MTRGQPPRHSGTGLDTDDERTVLVVTRVTPPPGAPRLGAAMWIVAAFVAVAVLKPWGGFGASTPTFRPYVAAPVEPTPVPTEDRSARGLAVAACLGTGAWRVASLETWRSRSVRVWRAIEPIVSATGPADPAIPAVPVVADLLSGLGWCAPAFGPEEPIGPARVRAWLVVGGAARALPLRQVQPVAGITPIAALYLPASGPWPSGRIVFQYVDEGGGTERWFAADLEILASAPTASPGASAPGSVTSPGSVASPDTSPDTSPDGSPPAP